MSDYTAKRGDWYHFNKRVPEDLRQIEDREFIQFSLKTKCPDTASSRATIASEYVDAYWADILNSGPEGKEQKFKKMKKLLNLYGFSYKPAVTIAQSPIEEIVARIQSVEDSKDDPEAVEAVLGGVDAPQLPLPEALDLFWDYARPNVLHKSPEQIRKWRNPRKRAVNHLIAVVGEKPIQQYVRADILALRDWWLERVESEGVKENTINKEILQMLKGVFETVNNNYEPKLNLDIDGLFSNLRIPGKDGQRPPYSNEHIQKVLLNRDELKGIDDDGWFLLCAMAETGAGSRELITRDIPDIVLEADIPHIKIRPNRFTTLKTDVRPRDIPLVGASLYAFQHLPQGFTNYQTSVDSLNSRINSFLHENGLDQSEDHSLSGFRHNFSDRLEAEEVSDRMRSDLMGHSVSDRKKYRYGEGVTLKHRQDVLNRIKFDFPN